MNYKLDTDTHVFFYEQEFYVLSNFSSFQIEWNGLLFPTSEHAYHFMKFIDGKDTTLDESVRNEAIQFEILNARSAHEAFQVAQRNKEFRRADWDDVKEKYMLEILRLKVDQHEYVRRKLIQTGDRILVEDSWRDNVWGWGPNKDGQNLLGKLWMRVRDEVNEKWV